MFTRSAGQDAGESFEGTIQMKGDKFTLVTPDALTWFNGTTQWTYVERNDEVNVTNYGRGVAIYKSRSFIK